MNSIGQYDLSISNISPEAYSINANMNCSIEVNFNLELDSSTIMNNIFIVEDKDRIINIKSPEYDTSKVLEGTFTYKNRTVFFSPREQLKEDCRYHVIVYKNTVKDIHGRTMSKDFVRYFDTDGSVRFKPTNITEPEDNSILLSLSKISCENVNADKYLFQVSKTKNFPNVILEMVSDFNFIDIEPLPDGLYFIRAKALNGDYGETTCVTVKSFKDTVPVEEDSSDDFYYEEIADTVSYEDSFPLDGEINVNEKTSVSYLVFNGELKTEEIDFYSSGFYGELSDEDDESQIESHGYIDCSFNVIYDEIHDKTYIVYIPVEIGGDIND